MIRKVCLFMLLASAIAGAALAQTATPDPSPPTPQAVTPAVPFQATAAPATVVPSANDARLAACAAPNLPNFVPYTVRYGDSFLADLLMGSTTITPTQLAALNCLDDSAHPPTGVTIWLPSDAFVVAPGVPPAAPESSATGVVEPEIIRFAPDSETVLNDQGVALNWEARGDSAYLYVCSSVADIPCTRPRAAQPVALVGSIAIDHLWREGLIAFRLEVVSSESESVTQDVTVGVTCAQPSLGSSAVFLCPEDPPLTVTAVWQPFQGGVMMWFSDTQQIYVMTNADGRVRVFQDPFIEGMPDPVAVAPEGLLTPIRGFGQVWQALGGAEGSGLGWAMAQEIGFDSARQPAGRTSYTTHIQGPGATVYALTEVPGMEMGYWAQVAG
jgi:hypothetical protein